MPQEEPVDVVAEALAITGMPDWDSPDAPGCRDTLALLPGEGSGADPVWALVPVGSGDDFVPLDPALAQTLIRAHVRQWLLERGWQVQAAVGKERCTWRLVDCLSFAAGGGDRLDADYPQGDEELRTLCESVIAVTHHYAAPRARGPG